MTKVYYAGVPRQLARSRWASRSR